MKFCLIDIVFSHRSIRHLQEAAKTDGKGRLFNTKI